MAFNFLVCDRDQEFLLPPSVREWLPEDHLAWFVVDAVGCIGLGGFYASYREDGWGRAAFDPRMMVALLLYAYAVGERSSRRIERRCREDVAFRVITANRAPDHATIARFRVRHERELAEIFSQVLRLCARAGLVSVGVVAVDGSLVAGDASPRATRSYASIRDEVEGMLAEAAEADAREDAEFGDRRGDELPAELADPGSRRARLRRALEEMEREQAAAEAAAQARYVAKLERRAAWEAEHGRRLSGRRPRPPVADALEKRKANATDPESRLMKRNGGRAVQGYNAQIVTTGGQVILAAGVTQAHTDTDQLAAMVGAAAATIRRAGIGEPIGVVVADGGYWNPDHIDTVTDDGIDVVIPPPKRWRAQGLEPAKTPHAQRMTRVLATPAGRALYQRRQHMAEPVFAHTKYLRRCDRFMRRGLAACHAEWRLIAATHNLLKLWRASLAAQPE